MDTDVRTTLYAEELRETTRMTWEQCCLKAERRRDMIAAGQYSGFSQGEVTAIRARESEPCTRLAVRRLHSPPGSRIARTSGLPRHRPSRDGFEASPLTLRMLGDYVTLRRHQWAELLDSLDSASDLARRVRELLAR